jgi:hypothetical protein
MKFVQSMLDLQQFRAGHLSQHATLASNACELMPRTSMIIDGGSKTN